MSNAVWNSHYTPNSTIYRTCVQTIRPCRPNAGVDYVLEAFTGSNWQCIAGTIGLRWKQWATLIEFGGGCGGSCLTKGLGKIINLVPKCICSVCDLTSKKLSLFLSGFND